MKFREIVRSAITGRFVRRWVARRWPKSTTIERVEQDDRTP